MTMPATGFQFWRASPAWVSIFGGIYKIVADFLPVRQSSMSPALVSLISTM